MHRFEGYHIPEVDDRGTTSHVPETRAQQYPHTTGSEGNWQSREEIRGLQALQEKDEIRGQEAIEHTKQEMREHAMKIADSFIALARKGKTLYGQNVTITADQHKAILFYLNFKKNIGDIDQNLYLKVSNMSYGAQENAKASVALYYTKRREEKRREEKS